MEQHKKFDMRNHSDEKEGGISFRNGRISLPNTRDRNNTKYKTNLKQQRTSFLCLGGGKGGLVLICCILLQSCSWFFRDEETSISTLTTLTDYENGVNGVYALLEEQMNDLSFFYPSTKGSDIYNGTACYSYFDNSGEISSILPIEHSSWKDLYQTITSANNIIVQYNNSKAENIEIKKIVGEAYFIRAYCYFRLTKIYGEIPIVDDVDINYIINKASYNEILEFIEFDLEKAQILLPQNKSNSRIPGVTAHRGTAKALLAEVYLYWSGYPVNNETKYELAASTAEQVIDSASFFGFELENDFASLWLQSTALSDETIFGVHISGNLFTAHSSYMYYPESGLIYYFAYYHNFMNYWAATDNFYNSYPKNYRRDITFLNKIFYANTSTYIDNIDTDSKRMKIGYGKFYSDMIENIDTLSENSMFSDISIDYYGMQKVYLYRYAHTLLTYAEAAAQLGTVNDKAYECLNMIRRRANNVDIYSASKYDIQTGLSADAFADSVVQERAWEFAGEPEGRWFDEIRTGQAGDNCFLDIPNDDILLNPNLDEN